jgi:hypothetical protein
VQDILIAVLSLHLLAGVFWAGTTFGLALTGGAGERLFRPQMGAATIAILAGGYLWSQLHASGFGGSEPVLGFGGLCAVAAAGVQGALAGRAIRELRNGRLGEADARVRIATAQRIATILLAVTIVCMTVARYV